MLRTILLLGVGAGIVLLAYGVTQLRRRPKPTITEIRITDVADLKPGDIVRVEAFGRVDLVEVTSNENGWVSTSQDYGYSHGYANRAIERGEAIFTLLHPSLGRGLLQSQRSDTVDLGDFRQYVDDEG